MKKIRLRWIVAALAIFAATTLTRCIITAPGTEGEVFLDSAYPGYVFWCSGNMLTVADPSTGVIKVLPGLYCQPSQETNMNMGGGKTTSPFAKPHARRSPLPPHHPNGSLATVTDDPQPNIFSEALEPANAAATSFQIQTEFPSLLPIPFGPLFPRAALANYNPACASNGSVYVANWAGSSVSRIASCPLAVLKTIPMPSNPIQVRLTPDGSTAVVSVYNNALAFINTSTDTATTLSTPLYNPYGLAISPDGTKAYVTSYSTSQPVIFQVNLATRQLLPQSLQINSFPKSIFLTPDGALAWVNFSQSSTIYVIDTLSMTVAATINAGGTADTGMAFSPDGTRAYVSVFGGSVSVFNTATLAQVASIQVGDQPTDIYVTKSGTRAYVNSFASNGSMSIIDTRSNTVIGTIPQHGPSMGLTVFH